MSFAVHPEIPLGNINTKSQSSVPYTGSKCLRRREVYRAVERYSTFQSPILTFVFQALLDPVLPPTGESPAESRGPGFAPLSPCDELDMAREPQLYPLVNPWIFGRHLTASSGLYCSPLLITDYHHLQNYCLRGLLSKPRGQVSDRQIEPYPYFRLVPFSYDLVWLMPY